MKSHAKRDVASNSITNYNTVSCQSASIHAQYHAKAFAMHLESLKIGTSGSKIVAHLSQIGTMMVIANFLKVRTNLLLQSFHLILQLILENKTLHRQTVHMDRELNPIYDCHIIAHVHNHCS